MKDTADLDMIDDEIAALAAVRGMPRFVQEVDAKYHQSTDDNALVVTRYEHPQLAAGLLPGAFILLWHDENNIKSTSCLPFPQRLLLHCPVIGPACLPLLHVL